jgi:hypothetical protein
MYQHPLNGDLARTRTLRRVAGAVLQQLLDDRDCCEAALSERGRVDAIKSITGQSSIDQAVARTRAIIDGLDRMLGDTEPADTEPDRCRTDGDRLIEFVTRPSARTTIAMNASAASVAAARAADASRGHSAESSCTMRAEPVHFTV